LGQGREGVKELLKNDEKLKTQIVKEVREAAGLDAVTVKPAAAEEIPEGEPEESPDEVPAE
jgi:hypothetical protein